MSKHYRGKDKIFYVFYGNDSKPCFSGTLEMCQNYMNNSYGSYSLDHRSFRPEFK